MILFVIFVLIAITEVQMFQQNDYTITYERLEVVRYSNEYFENLKAHNFKYNRTTAASNYTGIYRTDFGRELQVEVQAYKWASNEYRLFPMTFSFDFCSAITKNDFGLQNLYKCGNFTRCPLKKGSYQICNFTPEENKFPPYIPQGSYRIDLRFLYHSKEAKYLQFYGTVKRLGALRL